ncbi:MAG TPA: cytochrome c biogenesis protein ResB [Propioniciclava sp.]|uniref:cytochrome c biogenesis protein ResB n=1 Tax=Propioniciclava sp. TaxID=2038686 RepID=UPI002CCF7939|nr:cytochrome c biogenesis protein ResB [Propioniciclava sp.]HRL79881.1 cytochrome c biogenesis protein ResB [Propioniciclava sp.]
MRYLRLFWVQLTSMRTALLLLFTLALVAIPGSLLPQRPVAPIRVSDWKAANPAVADLYEKLGLFDVYHSPWFAAVYLLLMISLVGCIIPRIGVYVRALRTPPPRTPRHLDRLPASTRGSSTLTLDEALTAGEKVLASRRFRTRRDGDSVSAERGYLREFGNILFHLSFVVMLVGLGWNSLWGYKGEVITVEGQAFSNNLTQYDDFTAGAAFTPADLAPFTVWIDTFTAKFETGEVQRGAAREFTADVRVAHADGTPEQARIEVNEPLVVDGTQIHLIGHGYAPVVTVTDPTGQVAFSGPVVFLPQDGNFTSMGVIKAPDARPNYLGFEGYFLPTAVVDEQGPRSVFPDALAPELFLTVWTGEPRTETGTPESVYSLNKDGLTQMRTADGTLVTFKIEPGQIVDLPDGSTLSFDDWRRWTKLQVSYEPGLWLVIASVLIAVAGVSASLYVRPRRLWLRATEQEDGTLRIEVAGLDRAESATGLDDDVAALAAAAGADTAAPTTPADESPTMQEDAP